MISLNFSPGLGRSETGRRGSEMKTSDIDLISKCSIQPRRRFRAPPGGAALALFLLLCLVCATPAQDDGPVVETPPRRPTVNEIRVPLSESHGSIELTTETLTLPASVMRWRVEFNPAGNPRKVGARIDVQEPTRTGTGIFENGIRDGYWFDTTTGFAYRELSDEEKKARFNGTMDAETLGRIGPPGR